MLKKIIAFIIKIFDDVTSIFFVGSADKLPEPLSKEEEIEYVKKSMDGDEFARNKLIEHNLRLVVFLSKKYENTGNDLEDLVSIGTIGLIKGVNTYKLDKNIKLATYASWGEVSFEDNLSYDAEGNELHLEDILGTEPDIVTKGLEEKMDKKLLYQEINKLTGRDKEIMILRYGLFNHKEMTQKDVANMLGISQSYISRIEKKVIRRLKTVTKI